MIENNVEEYHNLLMDEGLFLGRLVTGNKTKYINKHPNNKVVFNANIITANRGKIWNGDLDLTRDDLRLRNAAKRANETLYVLTEHDGRFNLDSLTIELVESLAVKIYEPC
jgi:hypothetical protein